MYNHLFQNKIKHKNQWEQIVSNETRDTEWTKPCHDFEATKRTWGFYSLTHKNLFVNRDFSFMAEPPRPK